MIRIGILGIGFMGMTHFEAAVRMVPDPKTGRRRPAGRKLKHAAVTAICTRNPQKLDGDWRSIQGNFGPRGGLNDLSSFKRYSDAADLLNDPDIDLVDICLPTDQHAEMAIRALKAGKHVLVEKPIAIDIKDAQRMVRTAEQCRRRLFVGHVLPFFPEFAYVRESLEKGRFGALRAAHFRRVITPPDWSADMSDFRKLGGWGIDLHIHDNHFIAVTCGIPDRLLARGVLADGLVNHVHTLYVYEDKADLAVSCVSGGIAARGLDFAHGFELYFDEATLLNVGHRFQTATDHHKKNPRL